MPKRTFKEFSITTTSTPQPLVGTLTTSALIANSAPQAIPIADSSLVIFRKNDYVWIDQGSSAERIQVTSVSAGFITGIVTKNHLTGVTVALSIPFTGIYCQTIQGNAADLVIFYPDQQFSAAQVAPNLAGLIKAFVILYQVTSPTQPVDVGNANNFGANPDDLAYYWIAGTSGDSYLPSIDQT
jgi:hypothetical protein